MRTSTRLAGPALIAAAGLTLLAPAVSAGTAHAAGTAAHAAGTATGDSAFRVFAPSFIEDPNAHTVSLPRYSGTSQGRSVTYVITDASTKEAARRLGVNFAPRLANTAGTAAAHLADLPGQRRLHPPVGRRPRPDRVPPHHCDPRRGR